MERAVIDDIALEYEDPGPGEPVLCIHGAFVADSFRPLLSQRELTERYRLITYHRRGYAGSSRTTDRVSLAEQAEDCRRLLSHLRIPRAHVLGHSSGGAIGLQLALDAPNQVQTLSLLEPALIVGESADQYRHGLLHNLERYRQVGARVAVDEFLRMRWPEYPEQLERMAPGAFEQAVGDAATFFDVDLPAFIDWRFGEQEARRITQPALAVLGEKSVALHPRFAETHRVLLSWLPAAEGFVLPKASHFLQFENPRSLARALTDFYTRHPLGG